MSVANDAFSMAETAQIIPMVAGTEAAAKAAAAGVSRDAQGGPVKGVPRVGWPQVPRDRCGPPLGPRSCQEAWEERRGRLSILIDKVVHCRLAGRAAEGQRPATLACLLRALSCT